MVLMGIGNFLTAGIGTVMITEEFHPLLRRVGWPVRFLIEDCLDAAVAFLLGYFVFFKLKTRSAKCIWTVGAGMFLWRAIHVWVVRDYENIADCFTPCFGVASSLWPSGSVLETCTYTIILIRTVFYSLGAFCSSRFGLERGADRLVRGPIP